MTLLSYLEPGEDFPPTELALEHPNGLLAAGGVLDSSTLVAAYRRGIFPWYEAPQPVLWWSPDPRSVLLPEELHLSRSLRRTLRRDRFQLSMDRAFDAVIEACAQPRPSQDGTWIGSAMSDAYRQLHREGVARSVEVWLDGTLAGGLYGISLGGAFFGESMFARTPDASKVALAALCHILRQVSHSVIDCQIESEHLNSLGARRVSRLDFEERLQQTVDMVVRDDIWHLPERCGGLL